ncbi:MAG: class I tRNA ligase family protein [Planctomycetes bacterium]|nr:class I tRNA ligase family protein [Planctomycetota bacterium]
MPTELAPKYDPAAVEPEIARRWTDAAAFHADAADAGDPYCIVIPPPNVTAALHMGHALTNTLQDILIRWRRMVGDNAVWIPGTDHAGIATQTVVEKRVLKEEGKKRTDFPRDVFVQKIQAWKDEYEQTILGQLKAMGCSCDWERTRFTMDPICARAVREAFFRLFKDGLIYRGKRLVNWDPATQTALADDEVDMKEVDGHFYYLRYPLTAPLPDGSNYITVATTRPETMLGDTAVAINPKDPRAAALRGRKVLLPIVNRVIPIIEDDYVVLPNPESEDAKAKFATGFLKVTPAHDPNDYEIGLRHKLPVINVLGPDGAISKDHGWPEVEWTPAWLDESNSGGPNDAGSLLGKDRFVARKQIVAFFREREMLEAMKPYKHAVGHSYRSHVPIEPYLSDQWYVKVTDDKMRGAALRAMAPEQRSESGRATTVREWSSSASSSTHPRTAYFITFACYGTWLHGNDRGSVDLNHNIPGTPLLQEDDLREREEFHRLKHAAFTLDEGKRGIVGNTIAEVCDHRGWRLLEGQVRTNHVHVVVEADATPERVMNDFKTYSTRRLREASLAGPDDHVWARHGSTRYLNDEVSIELACQYVRQQEGGPLKNSEIKPSNEPRANEPRASASGSGPTQSRAAEAEPLPHGRGSSRVAPSLRFHPERYAKTFEQWHLNIRDWCISRQLWWGHRIPVWHQRIALDSTNANAFTWAGGALEQAGICQRFVSPSTGESIETYAPDVRMHGQDWDVYLCTRNADIPFEKWELEQRGGWTQDPDVLDTWFSSALWPFSTLSWPDNTPELQKWNPGNVLCTAREIITLWVSRMVMMNLYLLDRLPFTDVFVHAMIQDGEGRKMSKSLGNGVDPLDIIHSHGSDAMRFTLASMTTNTQDVRMPVIRDAATGRNTSDKFDYGRNFSNKLWNAVRFALTNLQTMKAEGAAADVATPSAALTLPDKWILSRLARAVKEADANLAAYEFGAYAQGLYDFIWRDLCDWYIEAVKPNIGKPEGAVQRRVLALCIDAGLRLLHPAMPFVTEKLWESLNDAVPIREISGVALTPSSLLIHAKWPMVSETLIDTTAEAEFEFVQKIVGAIREVRTAYKVPPRQRVNCSAKCAGPVAKRLLDETHAVETFANVELHEIGPKAEKPADAAATVVGDIELYLHGLVQADAEKARLTKRSEELSRNIAALAGRLTNKAYTDKAPANLVQQTRDQLSAAERELATVNEQLKAL